MDSKLAQSPINRACAVDAGVQVRQALGARDRDVFVRFAWQIYRDDPQWAPPLLIERKDFVNPRLHPFYLHGAAAQFLAYRNGQLVGRIQASDDPHYNAEHHSNVGCFGMFESIDDEQVAAALLQAAADWLRDRGRTQIMGPIDYSTNYACGLLIDGFDTPPRIMMNHNPPYYAALLEACGLSKAKDLYSWWFDDRLDVLDAWRAKAERLAARGRFQVRSFRLDDFDAEIERCKAVYNAAWERNWGFVKMSDAEFAYMAKHLRQLAAPELLLLAEVEGRPVGFSMTLPDLNEAIRPLDGRLFRWGLPIGLVRLLRNRRRIRTARLLTLGVIEGFRRRGISELLILRTLDYGKHVAHYTGAELGWTLEDNELINRTIVAVGGRRYKTYRIYEREI
ncbi:MAG TPA: GNAT family N-acetyltransferase [Pirellulales bacterium]|jgi:GNAT superfamily N-acetyltransferase|nr:GNAT family N-acetyltransferase [Pirellulales bacterium]